MLLEQPHMFSCERLVELLETDVVRVVAEASSADVQTVLSDQTVRVLANATVGGADSVVDDCCRFAGG